MASQPAPNSHPLGTDPRGSHGTHSPHAHQPHEPIDADELGLGHGSDGPSHGLSPGGAFRWSILLNSLLTGLQLVIGLGFGSLALVGDALHNLGDGVGLTLGWGADRLRRRPPPGPLHLWIRP